MAMTIYKVEFEVHDEETDAWSKGWYYFEDAVDDLKNYIAELMDEDEVTTRNIQVMAVQTQGWSPIRIKRQQ